MTKLLPLALLFCAGLASAETILFNGTGRQSSIDVDYVFNGSFQIPDNPSDVPLELMSGFTAVIYDIEDSYNPAYAFATYNLTQSSVESFDMDWVNGNLVAWTMQTAIASDNNIGSVMNLDWGPEGDGKVGGAEINLSYSVVGAATTPEPESYGMLIVSVILLVGLGIRRWRNRASSI